MAWNSILYPLALFWLVVHVVYRYHTRRSPSSLPTLLPSTSRQLTRKHGLNVELKHVSLRVSTTSLNDLHDRFTDKFARSRRHAWKRAACAFYDAGSVAGVIGMAVAIYLLCSTTVWVWRVGHDEYVDATSPSVTSTFRKRSFESVDQPAGARSSQSAAPVQLMVCFPIQCRRTARPNCLQVVCLDSGRNSPTVASSVPAPCPLLFPSCT
jgi:hypothetical protein